MWIGGAIWLLVIGGVIAAIVERDRRLAIVLALAIATAIVLIVVGAGLLRELLDDAIWPS